MDFSAANTGLWGPIIQIGVIAGLILLANVLRRKIAWIRRSMMPTAVLAGFLMLFLKAVGVLRMVDVSFLEALTYHALALGFIAMSLRVPEKTSGSGAWIGSKSGALIVSTYLVQAVAGMAICAILAYTVMPGMFKAAGILLPMAYGQGPGQANNIGTTYEALGMAGGRSFGLSLAAVGYLCACVVGVIFLNVYHRKGWICRREGKIISGSVTVDTFQDENEIPISESVDKFSVQAALVLLVYLVTYLVTWGITAALEAVAPGVAATVSTLLWGFNFILGSAIAILFRTLFKGLHAIKWMTHQYQNNYLLSRVSGLAFDVMIVAGIASIDIGDLAGNWLPFLLLAVAGAVVTFVYLRRMCRKLYPDYAYEGFFSMYGMLTGTISSGVLLLREIDPAFSTPAANNLVTGSSFGIIFGVPVLVLVGMAPKGDLMFYLTFGAVLLYLAVLLLFLLRVGKKRK